MKYSLDEIIEFLKCPEAMMPRQLMDSVLHGEEFRFQGMHAGNTSRGIVKMYVPELFPKLFSEHGIQFENATVPCVRDTATGMHYLYNMDSGCYLGKFDQWKAEEILREQHYSIEGLAPYQVRGRA